MYSYCMYSTRVTLPTEMCGGPGWGRVAFIDITDQNEDCPQELNLFDYSGTILLENVFETSLSIFVQTAYLLHFLLLADTKECVDEQ